MLQALDCKEIEFDIDVPTQDIEALTVEDVVRVLGKLQGAAGNPMMDRDLVKIRVTGCKMFLEAALTLTLTGGWVTQ